jgi:hypothetical protein
MGGQVGWQPKMMGWQVCGSFKRDSGANAYTKLTETNMYKVLAFLYLKKITS